MTEKELMLAGGAFILEDVIAVGNPCKVIRKITDEDKKYWTEQKERYCRLKNLVDKR